MTAPRGSSPRITRATVGNGAAVHAASSREDGTAVSTACGAEGGRGRTQSTVVRDAGTAAITCKRCDPNATASTRRTTPAPKQDLVAVHSANLAARTARVQEYAQLLADVEARTGERPADLLESMARAVARVQQAATDLAAALNDRD